MKGDKLKMVSFSIAVIGIIMICAVSLLIGPKQLKIIEITEKESGQLVYVNGIVDNYNIKDGNIFIKLTDGSGNITVVMFERTARNQQDAYSIKTDDYIAVKGQINTYKNELEIIASSIERR